MDELLSQLAAAAGIEHEYWDGLGIRRELHEATAQALLAALEFDPATPAQTHLEALTDELFRTPLPPTLVLREGETTQVAVALLPQDLARIEWEIVLEDGGLRRGENELATLALIATRDIDGRHYARFNLPLPADLPTGYHGLRLPQFDCSAALIVAPARCHFPVALEQGGRRWGYTVQLYSLRSSRNWGIGDFGDLARLAAAAGHAGAAFIGLNPLHARHLAAPDEASPYAPTSREFLDAVYIDVEAVADYAACAETQALVATADFQARLMAARAAPLVDYAAVTALKLQVLLQLFAHFQLAADRGAAYPSFRQQGGDALRAFATCEARKLQAHADAADGIEFQMYLQWLAAMQLAAAAAAARKAGMAIGLYRDLAVGAAHDSAETAGNPALFARGMSVGAPPDMLNRQGQNWGLPPWNPRELARQGYAPLRRLLAANMRDAGALRIDHVMALTRLFWIPAGMSGADGGYVRNHFAALAAIVALESVRHRCMVIGEDLGSVPGGLREALGERGFLSYRVLIYERHWSGDGGFCAPDEYPRQALAMVATHDMPPLHEYWQGGDLERRAALGLFPDQQHADDEGQRRDAERAGLLRLLGDCGLSPANAADAADVSAGLHGVIARSQAMLAAVQLDDLCGETTPVNIPGTHREYPNWRRKLSLTLDDIEGHARWVQLAAMMRAAGRA